MHTQNIEAIVSLSKSVFSLRRYREEWNKLKPKKL